jgi:hypothetical protein
VGPDVYLGATAAWASLERVGEENTMNKRLITTHPLFRLARLVLPETLLLHWFGRRIHVTANRSRRG